MNTGFFYDPIFLEHDTGHHPENSGRLRAIMQRLEADQVLPRLRPQAARPADKAAIQLIHEGDYVRRVEEAALSGHSFLDTPDCAVSEATFRASLHAAGSVVEAVRLVQEGRLDNAFVACRPPGHHAEHARAMGFCFFNNIAIGAASLLKDHGLERVLIFDFDVHHGNGTQHAFEESRQVLFCSMHQHPRTCYPGTGYADERGRGEGLGYTINVPMPPYSEDQDYLPIFEQNLLPAFREFDAQFVLVSAGFDAHRDDPLAQMNLTQTAFDAMSSGIKALAHECCGGKLVSILEGGYHYQRLSECVASHLSILLTDPV
jgi:acetoin utilization deacetylase AcuC-like enzyme